MPEEAFEIIGSFVELIGDGSQSASGVTCRSPASILR
jgi:hypothetical protein